MIIHALGFKNLLRNYFVVIFIVAISSIFLMTRHISDESFTE